MDKHYDVLIVGAGISGIGVGVLLKQMGCKSFCLIDRGEIGESFRSWPQEMRFITPSFPSQGFGQTDLNAAAPKTSPGYTLNEEHPTGEEYAEYLELLAEHYDLPVKTGVEVKGINKRNHQFEINTSRGGLSSKFVVWAAGEFQYPDLEVFPGAELCIHNSHIHSWEELKGDDYLVIGGYESGLDAAYQLNEIQKSSRVLAKTPTWKLDSSDPSVILSPYTFQRMQEAVPEGRIKIFKHQTVQSVRKEDHGGYYVNTIEGRSFTSKTPPILATGFKGSTSMVSHLFEFGDHGKPLVNEHDESTKCEGLFLCGPELRHDSHVFCYIYKFRQRFPILAKAVGSRLRLNLDILDLYRKESFYLEDLSGCGERCDC
ncbi:NAD(P)/FAD-dependent oxidoreductase [Halobacillus massiliensis]|uniref:NAD(P)/FAD-dependent oxidoreductase n=1 Tax=Halobacillus massiliensis TaxID=1926286 RepID=UPI0009E3B983|nr:NAD(P)/FAD-dependent oxidoreductase [Halobacillus massiliensis]